MNIVISAGGTGGHIFPAQAVANELKQEYPQSNIHFVAAGLRFFENSTHTLHPISSGKPSVRGLFAIMKGILQSLKILRKLKPKCLIGFGSYHTFPTLIAAKLLKIPLILHEANAVAGKVNRLLSPYAILTGVYFPLKQMRGNLQQVAMPIKKQVTEEDPYSYFQLDPNKKVILVFGGSQGAEAINQWVEEGFAALPFEYQLIHCTGNQTYKNERCYVTQFESRMDLAWKIASLVISRAGASTIAEQIEYAVPSILIPYPHAAENHQEKNARYVSETVKGGVLCKQENLKKISLKEKIECLNLEEIRQNIIDFKQHHTYPSFTKAVINTGVFQ